MDFLTLSFFAFALSFCTSALFHRLTLDCYYYSRMLMFSKVKSSGSSSKIKSLVALSFASFLCFKTSYTALSTRELISWTFSGLFLLLWNRTQPAPLPLEVKQVEFVDLACAYINLHEFILFPILCKDLFILLASSS